MKNKSFVIPNVAGRAEYQVPNLSIGPEAVPRLTDRLGLRQSFDTMRRDLDARGGVAAMDDFDREALRLMTGRDTRRAFNLGLESVRTRERYGSTIFGQGLLLARRLAEAGVGFVSVDGGWFQDVHPTLNDNWDDHETNRHIFDAMQRRLPPYDQAVAALIEDIYARGLDRDVLVVVAGEFGRTPLLYYHNGTPGRGHYPGAMTALVAGGGLRMGQVIGATSRLGDTPRSRLLEPADLLATIYQFLGVDPRRTFQDLQGRPIPILPGGEPIRELLA